MRFRFSIILVLVFAFIKMNAQQMNGFCIVGPFLEPNETAFSELNDLQVNWISLCPEVELNNQTLDFKTKVSDLYWTNSIEGYKNLISEAKQNEQKILLKPHVVLNKDRISNGKLKDEVIWRGEIEPILFWDWKYLEENYRRYILAVAQFAEAEKIEMLCVGTELSSFVNERPNYWKRLIAEVKNIYSGQVIYSANWDNYVNITFWSDLDFIGLNSYFPINQDALPAVEKTNQNWLLIRSLLREYSNRFAKGIIITEFGYKNVAFAGQEPWMHNDSSLIPVDEVQYNLLQSFFESIWNEEWLHGAFLWNYNYNPLPEGNSDFSPQNKPSLQLVKQYFKK